MLARFALQAVLFFSVLVLCDKRQHEANHEATMNIRKNVKPRSSGLNLAHMLSKRAARRSKWPSDSDVCVFTDMDYKLKFWLNTNTKQIHFELTYSNFPQGHDLWTGFAFGESMMSGLDATIVRVLGGQVMVSDEFVNGYGPSHPDPVQDVKMTAASIQNGQLRVQFTKPVETNQAGYDISARGCTTWQNRIKFLPVHSRYL